MEPPRPGAVATIVTDPRVRAPGRSDPGQPLEIELLLQYRLRIIALIIPGGSSVFNIFRLFRHNLGSSQLIWRTIVPGWIYVAVAAVLAWLLWRKRLYPLPQLRRLEAAIFGGTTLYLVSEIYNTYFVTPAPGWFVLYAQRHPAELSILACQQAILWLTVITLYGTFVPNTGRRCAVVTTLMALTPLVAITFLGLRHEAVSRGVLITFDTGLAIWLAIAVAIAIYGSHKITVLRQDAMAARRLGQYQLKQRLGQGGMGEVYLAEHLVLKRPCAVKVIRPEHVGDTRMLQRFLREVQTTATLTHPNTVQIFDYGQARDGTVFYAMEYLPGLTLELMVARHGPLPPRRLVFLLQQLCGALAEAHAIGLIHRDIKPGNVIICARGGRQDVAKLLDFGLVRTATPHASSAGLSEAGLIFGTPAYMSPEQASRAPALDARSDIYSLGALAYFVATGEPPFVRGSVVETLAAHLTDLPIALRSVKADVPPDVESIVMRCLAKNPDQRYPDVASLNRALKTCHCSGQWTQPDAASWWSTVANVVTTG